MAACAEHPNDTTEGGCNNTTEQPETVQHDFSGEVDTEALVVDAAMRKMTKVPTTRMTVAVTMTSIQCG